MKRFLITSIALAMLTAGAFYYPQLILRGGGVAGQKRSPRRSIVAPARKTLIDYSRFSHATSKHQGSCKTCHEVPTSNWQKAGAFPDVADFPGHVACVGCHRSQFFKGAQPAICSGCHQKTSPRDSVRFEFRNPTRPRQFTIEFPHDKHQDVIARVSPPGRPATLTASLRSFAHAAPSTSATMHTNSLRYNNCEICHVANTRTPGAPANGWTDGFVPAAATFKALPDSHAACFNCHWKGPQPTKDNCAGCHKLSSPYSPSGVPDRKSLKFTHAREQHIKECTACHINITKSASLRELKPDVPITACTECHNKDGLRLDVSKELEAIDGNRDFVCTYCHTSEVGRRDPPSSHYLIAGRSPGKRK